MMSSEHHSQNGTAGAGQGPRRRVVILGGGFAGLPREIEQQVTLRDVEAMEKLGATLRAMRGAAESAAGAASGTASAALEHGRL